jgi:hypothetical protein
MGRAADLPDPDLVQLGLVGGLVGDRRQARGGAGGWLVRHDGSSPLLSACAASASRLIMARRWSHWLADIRSAGRKLTEEEWIEVWARHGQYPA